MNSVQVHAFAKRLMREVWEPFDAERLSTFYHEDVVGHHRAQTLSYNDIVNRLAWDRIALTRSLTSKTSLLTKISFPVDSFTARPKLPPGKSLRLKSSISITSRKAKSLSLGCWPVSILTTSRRPNPGDDFTREGSRRSGGALLAPGCHAPKRARSRRL